MQSTRLISSFPKEGGRLRWATEWQPSRKAPGGQAVNGYWQSGVKIKVNRVGHECPTHMSRYFLAGSVAGESGALGGNVAAFFGGGFLVASARLRSWWRRSWNCWSEFCFFMPQSCHRLPAGESHPRYQPAIRPDGSKLPPEPFLPFLVSRSNQTTSAVLYVHSRT